MGKDKAGQGQLDVILDGLEDEELASEYDRLVGRRDIHRCQICRRPITAEESRAFGIGHDCARDLGRELWARMSDEEKLEIAGPPPARKPSGSERSAGRRGEKGDAALFSDDA